MNVSISKFTFVFTTDQGLVPSKKQHYVPQVYLKQFARDNKSLWVFDKEDRRSFKASIADIATGNYFYDHPVLDEQLGYQVLEREFSKLESHYSRFTARFEKQDWVIDEDFKEYFSAYVTYQLFRTKSYRKTLSHFVKQTFSQLEDMNASKEHLSTLAQLVERSDKDNQLQFLLDPNGPGETMDTIKSYFWHITVNNTNRPFICSDSPVVRHFEDDPSSLHLHLPITPKDGLCIMNNELHTKLGRVENGRFHVDKNWVKFYNKLQVVYSYRQVYSSSDISRFVENTLYEFPSLKDCEAPKFFVQFMDGKVKS